MLQVNISIVCFPRFPPVSSRIYIDCQHLPWEIFLAIRPAVAAALHLIKHFRLNNRLGHSPSLSAEEQYRYIARLGGTWPKCNKLCYGQLSADQHSSPGSLWRPFSYAADPSAYVLRGLIEMLWPIDAAIKTKRTSASHHTKPHL